MYKVREADKNYVKLVDRIPRDATYRHMSNMFFIVSIPVIGNLFALFIAIKCRMEKLK